MKLLRPLLCAVVVLGLFGDGSTAWARGGRGGGHRARPHPHRAHKPQHHKAKHHHARHHRGPKKHAHRKQPRPRPGKRHVTILPRRHPPRTKPSPIATRPPIKKPPVKTPVVKPPVKTPKTPVVSNQSVPNHLLRPTVVNNINNTRNFYAGGWIDPVHYDVRFDRNWWYRFYDYPRLHPTVSYGTIDIQTIVPPPNYPPAPPVFKFDQRFPMSDAGRRLASLLNGMDVDHHWLPGERVDWKTGVAVDSQDSAGPASNAGAFIEAVCTRLRVPMLAPSAGNFVPTRQLGWLQQEGESKGWMSVSPLDAQLLANQGWLVVAASKSDSPSSSHVAVVRPDDRPLKEIINGGPRIIQVGKKNARDLALKQGFAGQTWEAGRITFFAHRTK
jgi:hypothetical protein